MRGIGKAIRTIRSVLEVSQSDLAKKAGISNPLLSLVESGDRAPSLDVVGRIANALGIPSEALIVLGQGDDGKLFLADDGAAQMVASVQNLSDAEALLRQHIIDLRKRKIEAC